MNKRGRNRFGFFLGNESTGIVDDTTVEKAHELGIWIEGGSISPQHGHVTVYAKGKYPGLLKSTYALRSHLVWWLNTGEVIISGKYDIHHKNGNKIDDSFDNLEKLSHKEHLHLHNPKIYADSICQQCNKIFKIVAWRLKDKNRGKFCSQACYQVLKRKDSHKQAISAGLKRAHAKRRKELEL